MIPIKWRIYFSLLLFIPSISINCSLAQPSEEGLGQTIQIRTRLHSFVGRPSWLLILRDVDHGQTIPYVYDFERGNNFWIALSYSRNYLITASVLQFSPYRYHPYGTKTIRNFCQLESHGRIIRAQSLSVSIQGDLSPDTHTFTCQVMKYSDTNFYVVKPGAE